MAEQAAKQRVSTGMSTTNLIVRTKLCTYSASHSGSSRKRFWGSDDQPRSKVYVVALSDAGGYATGVSCLGRKWRIQAIDKSALKGVPWIEVWDGVMRSIAIVF